MRGCLFVLIVAALFVSVAAWFGAPVLASAVIEGGLRNAGFDARTLTTTATADPPPKLLVGRADSVRIQAGGVSFRTFHANRLDLTMTGVDLFARSFTSIRGTITAAEVKTADGIPTTADVSVDGDASAADATIVIDAATVDRVVRATFAKTSGVAIVRTELVTPDILRIVASGATIEGRIVVDRSGAIALSTRLGETEILRLDPSFPLRLRSVDVVDGSLRIDATLDAEALLGR
ncbi:MAG TPA: hypothetical protein VFJ71_05580 [Candidatus Limnocylindrales bacterium]|nr:hypothetical protein [Candidatus Limnocylindrales bacterium]